VRRRGSARQNSGETANEQKARTMPGENLAADIVRRTLRPGPLPACGEKEGPAKREGVEQQATSVARFSREI